VTALAIAIAVLSGLVCGICAHGVGALLRIASALERIAKAVEEESGK
jgi:hypothetical protein